MSSLPPVDASEAKTPETPLSASAANDLTHLIDSPDALESYLAGVRRRRETRRQERRAYWMRAVERLNGELRAAREERDDELTAELEAVIGSFVDALAGADGDAPGRTGLASTCGQGLPSETIPRDSAAAPPDKVSRNGVHAAQGALDEDGGPRCTSPASRTADTDPLDQAARQLREASAREALSARGDRLGENIEAHLDAGDEGLPGALRARALLCEGQALTHDAHFSAQGRGPLLRLLRDLAAGTPWEDAQPQGGSLFSTQGWASLSELYDGCVVAAEAMDWYEGNEQHLADQSRVDLLNAVAAAQQRLYRRPEGIVRRDDAVQELYRRLRAAGQRTAFIRALSQHVGDEELPALAGGCPQLLQRLQAEVDEARERAERQARKDAAVAAVAALEEALEGRGVTTDCLEADRQALCALLDECLAAGVPTTNVKVRAALMDRAPVLLEGQPRYGKFLEAVQVERTRRGMEAVEVAPPEEDVKDDDFQRMVGAVAGFMRDKRVVMLGGKSRPQVAQELRALLRADVSWPDSDRGDKFSKFASATKKADVVLMLKNFASHEFFYGARDAMAADGKHFVVLPSGYGVRQVVHQLSGYVDRERAA